MPFEFLYSSHELLDENDCAWVYREELSDDEKDCRFQGFSYAPRRYVFQPKEIPSRRSVYRKQTEQRGRFWVERHVPQQNPIPVDLGLQSHGPLYPSKRHFYAEKHVYDTSSSEEERPLKEVPECPDLIGTGVHNYTSGVYLQNPTFLNFPHVQHDGTIPGGADKSYKNFIKQLEYERDLAHREFKAKRDAEHKRVFEKEEARINKKKRAEARYMTRVEQMHNVDEVPLWSLAVQ
ncbi:Oidioi.mRNA.OKI2018_I69.XSR.g13898.t1.cds [Oikopleura dioica]|uniref:Oidioi.mRNA.OKI2018_I69.XSR.g13898.t1.cds n=1 Tax=Oikopleura dioica TaxID=34765 RepID=A0ABN7SGU8_OIKDI|nr:Oidioi.mRNA.OKI2018_I69.XSR.g13898.t1.cds [Oikopleura dioica]